MKIKMSFQVDILYFTLLTLLSILSVGLKLFHVISYPWLWVLLPLWAPSTLVMLIFMTMFFSAILKGIFYLITNEENNVY